MAFLEIQNLSKSFSKKKSILNHLFHSWEQGKIHGIIGKSGAGKSTLLRCLAGLEQPTSGLISFEGQDMAFLSPSQRGEIQKRIGMVFQSYTLLQSQSILENVLLPIKLHSLKVDQYKEKALSLLESVGLTDHKSSYPHQLSGGQRQRVAIARALILDPCLLLCDEFTSALDGNTTFQILELIKKLQKNFNLTVVLVTHDLSVLKECADAFMVLAGGKIIESGDVLQLFSKPQHSVTQKMIDHFYSTDLPQYWADQIHEEPQTGDEGVFHLFFDSRASTRPLISMLSSTLNVPVNIISGRIDHIKEESFGHLTVSIPYDVNLESQFLGLLEERQIRNLKIGYIQWK